MLDTIEYKFIKSKTIPILSELIFGKVFDYKYQQKNSLQYQIFKFHIDIVDYSKGEIYFISSDLNKNEKLCDEKFSDYKQLEQEFNFLFDHPVMKEDVEYFKWSIDSIPKYPLGNIYIFRLVIKEDLIIDFNLVSNKTKLYHKLNQKMSPKNKHPRSKI